MKSFTHPLPIRNLYRLFFALAALALLFSMTAPSRADGLLGTNSLPRPGTALYPGVYELPDGTTEICVEVTNTTGVVTTFGLVSYVDLTDRTQNLAALAFTNPNLVMTLLNAQIYYDHAELTLAAGATGTICVSVPPCAQVDLYKVVTVGQETRGVIFNFSDSDYYGDLNKTSPFFRLLDGIRYRHEDCEDFPPTGHPGIDGRMTGGGSIFLGDTRITHGFTLHCSVDEVPNRLQVNIHRPRGLGDNFHMDTLLSVICYEEPTGVFHIVGTGSGKWNGVAGYKIAFHFSDAGEPGTADVARIKILAPNGIEVFNLEEFGNHQWHPAK